MVISCREHLPLPYHYDIFRSGLATCRMSTLDTSHSRSPQSQGPPVYYNAQFISSFTTWRPQPMHKSQYYAHTPDHVTIICRPALAPANPLTIDATCNRPSSQRTGLDVELVHAHASIPERASQPLVQRRGSTGNVRPVNMTNTAVSNVACVGRVRLPNSFSDGLLINGLICTYDGTLYSSMPNFN